MLLEPCAEEMDEFAGCLRGRNEFFRCRSQQAEWNSCVKEHTGVDLTDTWRNRYIQLQNGRQGETL